MGVSTSAYPSPSGLRIAPVSRISNAASPRRVKIIKTTSLRMYIKYIHTKIDSDKSLTQTSRCTISVIQIQSCEV